MNRLSIPIILSCFVMMMIFAMSRSNHAYDRLSGKNGRLTVAHVYNKLKGVRGSVSYEYFYEVNNKLYYSELSGHNVSLFILEPVQCFIIAYDTTAPSLNTVLWNIKLDEFTPLGKYIPSVKNQDETIRKYSLSMRFMATSASLNKTEKIKDYKKALNEL